MRFYCLLLFFFTLTIQAQLQLNGVVKDLETKKNLEFASLKTSKNHTITDGDGKFSISTENDKTDFFEISYLGYQKTKVPILKTKKYYTVYLQPEKNTPNKDSLSKNDKADEIIKNTIENKKKNNPKALLSNFEFKSYNKIIVTAEPDSINGKLDSIFIKKKKLLQFSKIDSTNYKFKEKIKNQHLFEIEKISHFQYENNKLKETILGTKMSGFKQPIYEILAFNLQSFSIYDSKYELFETKYNSPIAESALLNYNYTLLDTLTISGRKSYLIHFKNKKKSKSKGLEGVLFIDLNDFAISKAIFRIKGILDISATHEFKYISDKKIWMPIYKTFKILKGNNDDDIKILGGTIQFDGDIENDFKTRQKQPSDYIYLISETDNFDFNYNSVLKINKPHITIDLKDEAIHKSEKYWEKYRKEKLDYREQKTYEALDSLVVKRRLENKIHFGRKIINGFLPIYFFDLDLRKILHYNNYEGFRLGIGGITNERFSESFKIEGYTAYGTKDGIFKYNLGIKNRLDKFSNSWIGVSYTDDIREIGSISYLTDKQLFKIYDPRPINISTFYNYTCWKTYLETAIIPKIESVLELSTSLITPKFNYLYKLNNNLYSDFKMSTAKISLQWSPWSDYMQTPTSRIETEKRYPKFTFQFTKSLPKTLQNDFDFGKFDFKTEFEKKYLNGQKTSLILETGYAFGNIPITHLYNTSPNNITKETIIQRITFAGKNSFETMYFNEFFSSEYIFFQFKHSLNRVKLFSKIKPSLVLVSRMAWGNLQHPEQHLGINYKTLDQGFFESGIELNQIFKGLGLTAFYRYGPNQLPNFENNIAVKLSFVFKLGI